MVLFAQTNWIQWGTVAKDFTGAAQSIATFIAILVAGIWAYMLFVRRREKFPRAKLSHKIEFWDISDDERLIRVVLMIENTSEVLLKVKQGHTWVQQMKPWPVEVLGKFRSECVLCEDDSKAAPLEAKWPLINEKKHKDRELEPRESDEVPMSFIVNKYYEQILIYSCIDNSTKKKFSKALARYILRKKPKPFGWETSNVIDFSKNGGVITNEGHGQAEQKPRPANAESPSTHKHIANEQQQQASQAGRDSASAIESKTSTCLTAPNAMDTGSSQGTPSP